MDLGRGDTCGLVAQVVELSACVRRVLGSIPTCVGRVHDSIPGLQVRCMFSFILQHYCICLIQRIISFKNSQTLSR